MDTQLGKPVDRGVSVRILLHIKHTRHTHTTIHYLRYRLERAHFDPSTIGGPLHGVSGPRCGDPSQRLEPRRRSDPEVQGAPGCRRGQSLVGVGAPGWLRGQSGGLRGQSGVAEGVPGWSREQTGPGHASRQRKGHGASWDGTRRTQGEAPRMQRSAGRRRGQWSSKSGHGAPV